MKRQIGASKMVACSIKGFGIIADDLTGAMDAGAGFLGLGLHPFVALGGKPPPDSAAVVISTDSRDMDPENAYKKVRRQARKLAGLYVYKKIDSTLRGNIGQELLAVMDALKFEKAVVCPAFPANGRTVVDSKLLIGNVPINETSFREDSAYPITEARIPTLLHKQTGLPVGAIGLGEVKKGPDNVFQKIKDSENGVIVVDAREEKHLRCLAQALSTNTCWLPCGSAGLAKELPGAFGYEPVKEELFEPAVSTRPVLAVAGSRNDVSVKQMQTAEKLLALAVISLEPEEFIDSRGKLTGLSALTDKVSGLIKCGKNVLITTAHSRYVPALKESTARLLARIAARIVNRCELAGLFLTGGDIARETCRALGVNDIRILKELGPGVILGEASGIVMGNVRIITKAGGFGGDSAIADAIRYLRGEK